jgi:hypothetical protein
MLPSKHFFAIGLVPILLPSTSTVPFFGTTRDLTFRGNGAVKMNIYCGEKGAPRELLPSGFEFTREINCKKTALAVALKSGESFRGQEDDVLEEDAPNQSNGDALMMVEVGVGVFVGVMIIAIVGVFIYRRRDKGKEKNGSPVSYQSSSDGVREEGLIDGAE